MLLDEHALLLTNDGQHTEALKIWESILPDWVVQAESGDALPAFARRRAAIAAARLGMLKQSSDHFREGAQQARIAGELVLSAGMVADAAFVEWKRGCGKEAISLFIDVLQRLDEMPNTKDELASFKLRKLTGQMLNHIRNWCAGTVTEVSYAPPIGSASDLNVSDRLRERPLTGPDMLWLLLAQTEEALRVKPRAFELIAGKLSRSQIPAVRFFLAKVQIAHELRAREMRELPRIAEQFADSYQVLASERSAGRSGIEPVEARVGDFEKRDEADLLAPQVLVAGLISAVGAGQPVTGVFEAWREASATLRLRTALTQWIALAEQTWCLTLAEAVSIMRSGEESSDDRILASLKVMADDKADFENLFYAYVTIAAAIAEMPVRSIAAEHLSEVASRQWLEKISPRQVLHGTRVAGPIRSACEAVLPPLQKLAGIVLAVQDAVTIRLPESLATVFQGLRDSPSDV